MALERIRVKRNNIKSQNTNSAQLELDKDTLIAIEDLKKAFDKMSWQKLS